MVDSRNIQFEIDIGYPFQLEYNPEDSKMRIIDNCNSITLYTKIQSFQHICFSVEFDLIWTKKVPFDENQYNILWDLFKERSEFYIYPNPSAMPDLKFLVNWIGKFDFSSMDGWFDGFGYFGTINLIGAEELRKTDFPEWLFNEYSY